MPARNKQQGYFTNEAYWLQRKAALLRRYEFRAISNYLHHPQIKNLFPCGEGAGYAGGIVSAAMDGERVAIAIVSST